MFSVLFSIDSESKLPAYLSPQPGLHSGLMIVHTPPRMLQRIPDSLYTRIGATFDTLAEGIEDYNSMGATSALRRPAALLRAGDSGDRH